MDISKAVNKIKLNPRRWPRVLAIGLGIILLLLAGSAYMVRRTYNQHLLPLSSDTTKVPVTILFDSSYKDIAQTLKAKNLIRSSWSMEWFVRTKGLNDKLLAGTYSFSQSQTVPEIVEMLRSGKVATDLVTILPSKRLEEIRLDLIKAGFSVNSVDLALDPANYSGHPAISDKPSEANLEGYLFPESFEKAAITTPEDIIRKSLDEMAKQLTPELRIAVAKRGLSLHKAITMASIIEEEISYHDISREIDDRRQVAQVFYLRLKSGMRLESDPTAHYGAFLAGAQPSVTFNSDYNTYKRDGLPPGPISNVSKGSLDAVVNPAATDWLYFVSGCDNPGDDIRTYFSRSLKDHEALIAKKANHECKH